MDPVKKRRRLPTLIDRGLGLLEVILPRGATSDPLTALPSGQRDSGGFWFPAGYSHPGDIFTAAQRRLQAKQRQVQRVRRGKHAQAPAIAPESERAAAAGRALPDVTPVAIESAATASEPADRAVPLPPPAFEAPGGIHSPEPGRMMSRTSAVPLSAPYPDRQPQRAAPQPAVVDSRKGSD
ncbi:MAG TPA: hypothetical protein VKF61_01560 [Candidatus Polarisedimenticolia bacterium]|nr:hypothetical protein [Candidatus Polarisedimenticolia bacterium]